MSKIKSYRALSLFTALSLVGCSINNPTDTVNTTSKISSDSKLLNLNNNEKINTDTTLKIDSIYPKGIFGIKANNLDAGSKIPGRFIIKFKLNGKPDYDNFKVITDAKAKRLGDIKRSLRIFLIEADNVLNNNVLETLKNHPDVEYIEQDQVQSAGEASNFTFNVVNKTISNSNAISTSAVTPNPNPSASILFYFNGNPSGGYNGYVGDVIQFNVNGTIYNYLIKDNCLEGPPLPSGLSFNRPVCQPPTPLTPITVTINGSSLQTFVGATAEYRYGTFNGQTYQEYNLWYKIKSNCLEGPALPQGVNASLPVCAASPSPTPTPTVVPTATPTPVPTPVVTPIPGRPSYLNPGPMPTPTATAIPGRPNYLNPGPVATPTATAIPGRPSYLNPSPTLSSSPSPIPSRPNYLPGLPVFNPNDPLKNNQYIISNTKLTEGLAISQGSAAVTIAIIDTGVEGSHEDLSGKIVAGYTAFNGSSETNDWNGHGTHCAGIAAAKTNNGIGIVGVAPLAKIMPIQSLTSSGSGSDASVASGIMYAADSSAQVLSLSLGSPQSSMTIKNAVDYALSKGKIVVAAMGNSPQYPASYPAAYPGVIAVGATDSADQVASFSQTGSHISVTAPGVYIYSTFRGNSYTLQSGTSMACPAVSGLAALLLGYKSNLTTAQIKTAITSGSKDLGNVGFDNIYGHGRINVQNSLTSVSGL